MFLKYLKAVFTQSKVKSKDLALSGIRSGNHSRDASRCDRRRYFGNRDGDRDQIDLRFMVSMRRSGLCDFIPTTLMRRLYAPSERLWSALWLHRWSDIADDGRRAGIRNAGADSLSLLLYKFKNKQVYRNPESFCRLRISIWERPSNSKLSLNFGAQTWAKDLLRVREPMLKGLGMKQEY